MYTKIRQREFIRRACSLCYLKASIDTRADSSS